MATKEQPARWRERVARNKTHIDHIRFPSCNGQELDQDQEWCEIRHDGCTDRVRFHDYHELYRIPGCYEAIFYERLQCCSPERVVGLLEDVMKDFDAYPSELKVLDLGAGNGMVGDELDALGAKKLVGVDIIMEAKEATDRDRPGVYNDYFVTDMTDVPEREEERLRKHDLNCLTTVAALGYGDIPPRAFLKALDLIATPGWLAFNIKERFLHESDSGFAGLIRRLSAERIIQIQAYRRYQHRISIAGEPLYYVAMVARKLADLPDELMHDSRQSRQAFRQPS